jgi:hypothetical protein
MKYLFFLNKGENNMNELQQLINKFGLDLKTEIYNCIQTFVDSMEARQLRLLNNLYSAIQQHLAQIKPEKYRYSKKKV